MDGPGGLARLCVTLMVTRFAFSTPCSGEPTVMGSDPNGDQAMLPRTIFALDIVRHSRGAVVSVTGDLDLETCGHLTEALDALAPDGGQTVTLDLAAVTFMGTEALHLLLGLRGRARAEGWALHLSGVPYVGRRVLELTGTHRLFVFRTVPAPGVPGGTADRPYGGGARLPHADGGGGGSVVVRVSGELDIERAPALGRALQARISRPDCPPEIVLDLAELGFCDSSGLNALLRALASAEERGRRLTLRNPSPQFLRLLRLTGTGHLFPLHAAGTEGG
ncbi:anti-sigma factor antagonist [Streptomyces sp. WAC07149]|nr:anti-sigma factor antagonist [Streptomyces sp. WAC07149]